MNPQESRVSGRIEEVRRAEPRTKTNPVPGRDDATDRDRSGSLTNWVRLCELSESERELVANAEKAVLKAVAIQSGVRVGATVQTRNGIHDGCNVESVISGLGICAERNAINHAIIHRGLTHPQSGSCMGEGFTNSTLRSLPTIHL